MLPPDSGEKVSLNVTVLLGLVFFLRMVAEIMPPQSQTVPIMSKCTGQIGRALHEELTCNHC